MALPGADDLAAPHTYVELRSIAERILPGARYRRHLLWRYSITWTAR